VHVDILVVGGGPIGAVAARSAAEAGASVLLVDRRTDLTTSSCCTGLISPRTLPALGVSSDCVLQEIRAVRVHAPDGRCLDLAADRTKALVIDRSVLERELHRRARTAGVRVRLGTDAVSASNGGVVLESGSGSETVDATVVIGADGPCSRVAEWFGLPPPEQLVRAAQAVVETDRDVPTDRVEILFGRDVAPGFFAWVVPAERRRWRIGLGVSPPRDPSELLDRLLARRFPGALLLSRAGGPIPVSPCPRTAAGSTFLVGDAAGQAKPLSGGGLYFGAICARIAARAATETALSETPPRQASADYESRWRSAVGRELAFGRSIRRTFGAVSDRDLNALFAACDDPDLLFFLAEHGDIDRFHRLPDELAGHPSLWGKVLRLLPLLASREILDPFDPSLIGSRSRTDL